MNTLFYGDNLHILRERIASESVDLIYLDPPFNSARDYNVLFKEKSGESSPAQIKAFSDSWSWTESAFHDFIESCPNPSLIELMRGFVNTLGRNDLTAYLVMMASRLFELHRVLKPTGSLYLHCDPTASHYLKIVLDVVFGARNYRNEITWKRRVGMSSAVHESNRYGICTDIILFYAKSDKAKFNPQYNRDTPEYQEYINDRFTMVDENGRNFQATSLVNPALRPNLIYEYKGYQPPANGWMISKEKMELWDQQGRLYFPKEKTGRIRRKSFADELRGMPIQNLWGDISEINSRAAERLGYPTQKPLALLERIINASSDPGDVVLDPFCGCGTATVAAQHLGRQWMGIDITHLAITLIKYRLTDMFGLKDKVDFRVVGAPVTAGEARALAQQDRDEFQRWAVGLVPRAMMSQEKKGADRGIDGVLYFSDDPRVDAKKGMIQVKSGGVGVSFIRDLRGVVEREKATLGLFLSLDDPTKPMIQEAGQLGFYTSPLGDKRIPRLQLRTVGDLLQGHDFDVPSSAVFEGVRAAQAVKAREMQHNLQF